MSKLKKVMIIIVVLALNIGYTANAQVSINKDGTNPDASAMLDVKATDAGLLPPRMTSADRDAIISPANGLIIYNTETGCMEFLCLRVKC